MAADHGDSALAARVRELLGPRHPVAAAATVTPAGTTVTSLGAELDSDFEIGSISKGVTGLLYADAIERGEVQGSTTLGDLLPVAPAPVADVTLAALATHRAGLPSLPRAASPLRRTVALWRHGSNPYGETLDELLEQARGVHVGRHRPRYSNLGFQLLGHALAATAGSTYTDLVRDRVAAPLGLASMYAPRTSEDLMPTALAGRTRGGRPRQPWTGEALAPAGGLRAAISDMGRLATALVDGSAPGVAALDPVATFAGKARIGAAWITLDVRGRAITLHNGGTGGFRSWLGLDRQAGCAVVLLSATSLSVDRHGFALLAELARA